MRATGPDSLVPYVPRLVIEWLESAPEQTHRTISGTGVFADISGFTNLTERLAKKGRVGAEEMGDTLNLIFDELLGAAYQYGAGLVKWGGDAVLLLFEGEGPPRSGRQGRPRDAAGHRAHRSGPDLRRHCPAAHVDRRPLGRPGLHARGQGLPRAHRHRTRRQPGRSDGDGRRGRRDRGQPRHRRASRRLGCAELGAARGPGLLLVEAPAVAPVTAEPRGSTRLDLRAALPASIAEHVLAAEVAYEHRNIAVCFIEFAGVDALRAASGVEAVAAAVGPGRRRLPGQRPRPTG